MFSLCLRPLSLYILAAAARLSPLISSLYTLGYAYDCCALAVQFYTFNVGVRNENRFVFSFRLNGIGSFGTEQYGQGLR